MLKMTLDAFRGMAQSAPESQPLVLNLVKAENGFILTSDSGMILQNARGSHRVFSKSDTAINFVSEQIARPVHREVVIRCRVPMSGGLF